MKTRLLLVLLLGVRLAEVTADTSPATEPPTTHTDPPTTHTEPPTTHTEPPTTQTEPPTTHTDPATFSTNSATSSTGPSVPTVVASPGTSTSPASTASPTTTLPTTTPAPTIKQDMVTFMNSLAPPDAKSIMQQAVALTNHVNSLSQQIITLQAEIDPETSPLILELANMTIQTSAMNATLISLQSNLTDANAALISTINQYNNMSRIYTCMSAPNCTKYPESCNKNYNSTIGTWNSATMKPPSPNEYATGKFNTCMATITSAKAPINFNISVFVNDTGTVTIRDLNTNVAIATITNSTTLARQTNTTGITILADPSTTISYNVSFISVDPCLGFNCDNATTTCTVSSLGQPSCVCTTTNSTCISMNSDEKSCSAINPCTTKNINICNSKNQVCQGDGTRPGCPYSCTIPPSTTTGATAKLDREEQLFNQNAGFFSRWGF